MSSCDLGLQPHLSYDASGVVISMQCSGILVVHSHCIYAIRSKDDDVLLYFWLVKHAFHTGHVKECGHNPLLGVSFIHVGVRHALCPHEDKIMRMTTRTTTKLLIFMKSHSDGTATISLAAYTFIPKVLATNLAKIIRILSDPRQTLPVI